MLEFFPAVSHGLCALALGQETGFGFAVCFSGICLLDTLYSPLSRVMRDAK